MRRRLRIINDPPAGSNRGRESRLDMLASNRNIDVHRVPQRLVLIECLHPHRRSVSKRVDGIVARHGDIAKHGAPEVDVDRPRL